MIVMWNRILHLVFAGICAVEDYRTRQISVSVFLIFAVIGTVMTCLMKRSMNEVFNALIPGLLLAALSFASSGCIGIGDALFVIVGGLFADINKMMEYVLITWILSSGIALIMIVKCQFVKNGKRPKGLPFVTLMAAVMLVCLFR